MRWDTWCQQCWLSYLPLIIKTKLISCLCRPRKLVVNLKHSSAKPLEFNLSDAIVDFNKHSCEWAETKSWICRKWLNNHLSAVWKLHGRSLSPHWATCQLESENWWKVYIGNEDVSVCIQTQLTFTYAWCMSNQNGPEWQPLPVFICSRKSPLTLATSTKLFLPPDSYEKSLFKSGK